MTATVLGDAGSDAVAAQIERMLLLDVDRELLRLAGPTCSWVRA